MKLLRIFLTLIFISPVIVFSQNTFCFEYGELNVEEAPFCIVESETGDFYSGIYKRESGVITSHILKISDTGVLISEIELPNKRLLGITEINTGLFCYGINETDDEKPLFFLLLNENLEIIKDKNYYFDNIHNKDIFRGRFIKKNDTIHCSYTFFYGPYMVFSVNTNCDSLMSFSHVGGYIDICENPESSGFILTGGGFPFPGGENLSVAFADKNLHVYRIDTINILPNAYGVKVYIEKLNKHIVFSGNDYGHNQNDLISTAVFDTCMNKLSYSTVGTSNYDNNIAFYDGLAVDSDYYIYTLSTVNNEGGMPYLERDNWLMLTKTDSMQNVIWERYYGGDAFYQAYNFTLCSDGGIAVAAVKFDHEIADYDDVYIFKVDSEGNPSISLSVEEPKIKAHELILYPNPGNEQLNIRTAMQRIGGEFNMYDITGKLIHQQKITERLTKINTLNLMSGTYIYNYTHKGKEIESGKWVKQ